MIHSIFSASHYALAHAVQIQQSDREILIPRARLWSTAMSNLFLGSYIESLNGTSLAMQTWNDLESLMRVFLIERALIDLEKAFKSDKKLFYIAPHCLIHYLDSSSIISLSNPAYNPLSKGD